jgi:hypothetical protein
MPAPLLMHSPPVATKRRCEGRVGRVAPEPEVGERPGGPSKLGTAVVSDGKDLAPWAGPAGRCAAGRRGWPRLAPELYAKRLQLLKETLPTVGCVGLLLYPT